MRKRFMAKTTVSNGVEWYQDWDNSEGGIVMVNAKTIKRYREIQNEHPNTENYGVFFAFGTDQFEQGCKRLITKGYLKDGEKVCNAGAGIYGTKSEIDRFMKFYDERGKRIVKECNPQEVYFSEWNDHECMFTDDDAALKVVIEYFGKEVAHKIERVHAGTATNVLAPMTTRDEHLKQYDFELMMLGRLKFDCDGFFSEGDCRYHRPDCLWGSTIKRQVEEMRTLYAKLPDDIKDAACVTPEQIDEYENGFEQWAEAEFDKPEYDPVPATPREKYEGLEIEVGEKLYYKDDDGQWQTPSSIWFSGDSRRWHQDKQAVHGRAFTSYLGKHGTTLAPVYITDWSSIGFKPYRRDDLCDVTARYEYKSLHSRLYKFHHE